MRGNRSRKIFKNSFVPIIVLILFGTISIVDAQCSAGQQVNGPDCIDCIDGKYKTNSMSGSNCQYCSSGKQYISTTLNCKFRIYFFFRIVFSYTNFNLQIFSFCVIQVWNVAVESIKSKIQLLQLVANIVLVVKNLKQSLPIVSFVYNFFFVLSSLTNFNLQFFLSILYRYRM